MPHYNYCLQSSHSSSLPRSSCSSLHVSDSGVDCITVISKLILQSVIRTYFAEKVVVVEQEEQ